MTWSQMNSWSSSNGSTEYHYILVKKPCFLLYIAVHIFCILLNLFVAAASFLYKYTIPWVLHGHDIYLKGILYIFQKLLRISDVLSIAMEVHEKFGGSEWKKEAGNRWSIRFFDLWFIRFFSWWFRNTRKPWTLGFFIVSVS